MTQADIDALREELFAKGWTYSRLAAHFDCSPSHVSAVLRGKRQSYTLLALLRYLPPAYLTKSPRDQA